MKTESKTIQALRVLAEHGPLSPSQFADRYYPREDPRWRRQCKCGRGSHPGMQLVTGAGGFLGKLTKAGLASRSYRDYGHRVRYGITAAGRERLRAMEASA